MIIESTFKPAWWLLNSHAQTLYASLMRRVALPKLRYERIELPDEDFIDLAWREDGLANDRPLVVILHGLGGGLSSPYIRGQLSYYQKLGYRVVLMHFRGASAEINRMLRAYHSGDTQDLNYVLHLLQEREPKTEKFIVGFSLGGSVLLKWLGENPSQSILKAAIAVSVPFQLEKAACKLNTGFSRIYQNHLLKKLRQHFLKKLTYYPHESLFQTLHNVHNFLDFDDQVTAPLHGFNSGRDYYQQCSSRAYLTHIRTPTLIIHAKDDPFMTAEAIPTPQELSSAVTLELSPRGGHVGFITGKVPGHAHYWLDARIENFFINSAHKT